jgi:acetyl-CoA carboxylase carboxyl transferase subunit alpha
LVQLRLETYTRLTPPQKLQVARHPQRPTFLDIICNICDDFLELHGDRAGYDDPAMVCGLATIDGDYFMCIGHQKGRNTVVCAFKNK